MQQRKMIIIGTLHGLPRKEIDSILDHYQPDQVMIEMSETDVIHKRFNWYPSEMKYAYQWARLHQRNVNGYDIPQRQNVNTLPLKPEEKIAIHRVERYASCYGWKTLNKRGVLERLLGNTPVMDVADRRRERSMLPNVRRRMIRRGVIVLFTGAGHLDSFEKNFPYAVFPYR